MVGIWVFETLQVEVWEYTEPYKRISLLASEKYREDNRKRHQK